MGVTLQGSWWYAEDPEAVNRPGSYLFEPAQCTHTLLIPEQADEPTIVWFALWGCNIQLKDDDSLDMVVDARGMLMYYRMLAQMQGKSLDKVFVTGE